MQTACGIYDNKVVTVILCVLDTLFNDLSGVYLTHFKYRHLCLCTNDFQLFDSSRSVNVRSDKQRSFVLILEQLCELCSVGGLT